MICGRVIQGESSSSNPDVGRFCPDSLRSGNHRKSLEVLAFNLHAEAHVKTSNESTVRGTNARRFLGTCGSCWFQQDGATAHTTIRARSWLKSRFGGSHQLPDQAPVAGQKSGLVPLDLVLERCHNRPRKTPNTTLVELKETIESFAQSMDEEEQAVRDIRRRARACLERNSSAFEERQ